MRVLCFLIGILTMVSTAVTIGFLIRNYVLKNRNFGLVFSVFKENTPAYFCLLLIAGAFGFIILITGFLWEHEDRFFIMLSAIFLFSAASASVYQAARLSHRRAQVGDGDIVLYEGLFISPKTVSICDIDHVKITSARLFAMDKSGKKLFEVSTMAINYNRLLELLDKNGIERIFPQSESVKEKERIISVRPSLAQKILMLFVGIILFGVTVFLIVFDTGMPASRVFGIVGTPITFFLLILLVLMCFRWRLDIIDGEIFYTPAFGKSWRASCNDIWKICRMSQSSHYKSYYLIVYFSSGKKISSIPYNYRGVQEFIDLMRDMVVYLE